MRFTLRSLLLMTTLAALYAVVIGTFLDDVFQRKSWDYADIPLIATLVAMLAWQARKRFRLAARLKRQKAAINTVLDYRKQPLWHHLVIFGCFLLSMLFVSQAIGVELPWLVFVVFIALHWGIETTQQVQFTTVGVITTEGLFAWEDYLISLKVGDRPQLICSPEPNTERVAPTNIPLPRGCEEEVRAILAARQGEGETTDDTDVG